MDNFCFHVKQDDSQTLYSDNKLLSVFCHHVKQKSSKTKNYVSKAVILFCHHVKQKSSKTLALSNIFCFQWSIAPPSYRSFQLDELNFRFLKASQIKPCLSTFLYYHLNFSLSIVFSCFLKF